MVQIGLLGLAQNLLRIRPPDHHRLHNPMGLSHLLAIHNGGRIMVDDPFNMGTLRARSSPHTICNRLSSITPDWTLSCDLRLRKRHRRVYNVFVPLCTRHHIRSVCISASASALCFHGLDLFHPPTLHAGWTSHNPFSDLFCGIIIQTHIPANWALHWNLTCWSRGSL